MKETKNVLWFFAYDSAMNNTRLEGRGVKIISYEPAYLNDYEFKFNKRSIDGTTKANIVRVPDKKVYGIIYKVPKSELTKLDNIVGKTSGHYDRQELEVITMKDEIFMANVYTAVAKYLVSEDEMRPSEQHVHTIVNAAVRHRLDPEYIAYLKSFIS